MAIIEGARSSPGEGHSSGLIITDVTIPTADLLTLFTTEVDVLAAPGANKAHIVEGIMLHKPAGVAYAGVAAGEDIAFGYTNKSGLVVATVEVTGFLDSTSALSRWTGAYKAASGVSSITPVANAVIAAFMLTGEIITGDSDLLLRIYHRIVPTVLT